MKNSLTILSFFILLYQQNHANNYYPLQYIPTPETTFDLATQTIKTKLYLITYHNQKEYQSCDILTMTKKIGCKQILTTEWNNSQLQSLLNRKDTLEAHAYNELQYQELQLQSKAFSNENLITYFELVPLN